MRLIIPALLLLLIWPSSLLAEVRLLKDQAFVKEMFTQISQAKRSIHISTFVFKTTKNRANYANRLVQALIKKSKSGVKVVVVLEKSSYNRSINHANARTMKLLKGGGVDARFDHPKKQSHAKLAIFDGVRIILGSHNLTDTAMRKSREVSLIMEDREKAQELILYIQGL